MTNLETIAKYKQLNNIAESVNLLTFASWKAKGYSVKRGQKASHVVPLYKHKTSKVIIDGEQTETSKCFLKNCYLFTIEQVERIEG